jgi:hypothetical protein
MSPKERNALVQRFRRAAKSPEKRAEYRRHAANNQHPDHPTVQ